MENDPWSGAHATSKRRQPTARSMFEACLDLEEIDGAAEDDDCRPEFPCPFCSEEFDVIGLCCHIDDEHLGESKNGICPICATRVEMDMVDHIAMQHGSFFKMPQKSKFHKGSSGFHSVFSTMRKDLCDGNAPSGAAPDPFLELFNFNFPVADPLDNERLESSGEVNLFDKISDDNVVESVDPSRSYKDQVRTRRSEFAQELLLSTIFKDPI